MDSDFQTPDSRSEKPFTRFVRELRHRGLYAALALLNNRTRFRYTGVYRFAPPLLHNVCLFDRENPQVRTRGDLQLDDTYCGIVARSGEPLVVENSLTDHRLLWHPSRKTVIAYNAVPLLDTTDKCFGSLCHWDVRPRLLPVGEADLLHELAPLVAHAVIADRRRTRVSEGAVSLRV